MRQDYLHEVFEKQVDIALRNLEKIHQRIGNTIQAACLRQRLRYAERPLLLG